MLLGSRGQRNILLAGLAAVLGLFSFFLALYFRLSLAYAGVLGLGMNVGALPFGDFFDTLKLYLQDNPINYIYFVVVPLIAGATAFRGGRTSPPLALVHLLRQKQRQTACLALFLSVCLRRC